MKQFILTAKIPSFLEERGSKCITHIRIMIEMFLFLVGHEGRTVERKMN